LTCSLASKARCESFDFTCYCPKSNYKASIPTRPTTPARPPPMMAVGKEAAPDEVELTAEALEELALAVVEAEVLLAADVVVELEYLTETDALELPLEPVVNGTLPEVVGASWARKYD
jgi:hypothetical protein